MNSVVSRIQIKVPAARHRRRLSRLWIGVNNKFIFARRHREAIAPHSRIRSGESLIEKPRLHERVKISIRAARSFRLSLCGSNCSQRLNGGPFISRAHGFGKSPDTFRRIGASG